MNEKELPKAGFLLRGVSQAIRRELNRSSEALRGLEEVTGTHGWVLRYLQDHEEQEVFQRDLEKVLCVRRSSATAILQQMERAGLIYREPVPYDARLKKIVLTEKAKEMQERICRDIWNVENRLVEGISPEEMETFYRVLDRMHKNLGGKEID